MDQDQPLYRTLLKGSNLTLIVGALLILSALGVIKVGNLFEKTQSFGIEEGVTELQVNFTSEFSRRLMLNDMVECALSLVPKEVSGDSIKMLSDVERYGGEILETVIDDVN